MFNASGSGAMKTKPTSTKKHMKFYHKNIERTNQLEKAVSEERTFSDWLRSEEGIENLKLFVLGNTILVFIALSWPHIKETMDAAYFLYLDYTKHN